MASHSSSLEDMLVCSQGTPDAQRKLKPPAEQSLKCPRCESTNTKFCYYNNYSLSQPRYFCKSCRRYWTKGGTLRNVPVGGGCRKNKKPSSSKRTSHLDAQFSAVPASPNPGFASSLVYDPIDLGLQFGGPQKHLDREFPVLANLGHHNPGGSSVPGFLDTLRNGIFLETQNNSGTGFGQSLYHGLGHGGGIMFSSYEESAATKGEPFSGNLEGDGRVLWGFPWQVNSDHELDSNSGRAGWTGLNPSTWQGLLNSPLIN